MYRARRLQVYLDGEERWQYDPRVGVCEPFLVPLSASSLELFGDDAEGPLLLAVFSLPEPEVAEADGALHLSVTLEGGQTVALAISLGEGTGGEEHAYVMQLTYTESAVVDRQGAEPPAVDALPAVPRPEPSTPWSAACATPPRPGLGAARAPGGARTPRL